MVTGSHIPFDRNGIKFYRADGEIDKADEQAILDTEVAVPDALSPSPLSAVDTAALDAYARAEPQLIEQLLELRRRFVEADLGEGIATPYWPAQ